MEHFRTLGDGAFVMGNHDADITVRTAAIEGGTSLEVAADFSRPFDVSAKIDSTDPAVVAALAKELGTITDDMRTDMYRVGKYTLQLGQVYIRPEQFGMGRTKEGAEAVLRIEPPITVGANIDTVAFGRLPGFNGPKGDINEIMTTQEATLLKVGHTGLGKTALTTVMKRIGDGLHALDSGDLAVLTELTQNQEQRFER